MRWTPSPTPPTRLIHELVTNAPPKDREAEAEKRRARARQFQPA